MAHEKWSVLKEDWLSDPANRELFERTKDNIRRQDIDALVKDGASALAAQCQRCDGMLQPEHAHYRCDKCHERDGCCW